MAKMLSIVHILRLTLCVGAFLDFGVEMPPQSNKSVTTLQRAESVTTLPMRTEQPSENTTSLSSIALDLCCGKRKVLVLKLNAILKGGRKDNEFLFNSTAKMLKRIVKKLCKGPEEVLHCWLTKLYDTDGNGILENPEILSINDSPTFIEGKDYHLEKCGNLTKKKGKKKRRKAQRRKAQCRNKLERIRRHGKGGRADH